MVCKHTPPVWYAKNGFYLTGQLICKLPVVCKLAVTDPVRKKRWDERLLHPAESPYDIMNTPMAIKQTLHLRSDSTARPFDISLSPDPTAHHHCPYTTIGADINITGPPRPTPKTYQPDTEDILNIIPANADNNLQRHERIKLGRMHKPSNSTTPFIHGDEVIGELSFRCGARFNA